MLKAIKDNKIYTIAEVEKQSFLDQGFDIILENGKIEKSSQTPVTIKDLEKLKEDYEKKLAKKDAEIKKLKGETK